jgi:hypothetical protein
VAVVDWYARSGILRFAQNDKGTGVMTKGTRVVGGDGGMTGFGYIDRVGDDGL